MVMLGLLLVATLASTAPQTSPATVAAAGRVPQDPADQNEYRVGARDILRITVYGHDDLTQIVTVQPDGTITFPLVGRLSVAGKTPQELETALAGALGQGYIRAPQVSAAVQEYRSQMVYVVGEVARPGTYPVTGRLTIVEILSRAGPMTGNAGVEVVIVRPSAGSVGPLLPNAVEQGDADKRPQVIRVNIQELQSGDLGKNPALLAGDTVFVPPATRVYASGEVRNSGAYPFSPSMTVRQLISLAGGLTEDASVGKIRIVRVVGGRTKELKVRLDDPVQPGDTVLVKQKLF